MQHYQLIQSQLRQAIYNNFMSSFIDSLTNKYKTDIGKQQMTSGLQKVKPARLEKLAQTFMCLMVQLCSTESQVQDMSQTEIKDKAGDFFQFLSIQRNMGQNELKKIIGQYVNNEFINNSCFQGLRGQFSSLMEGKKEIESPHKKNQEDDQQDYRTYLSHLSQNSVKKISTVKSEHQFEAEQYFQNTPHWTEVINYLTAIKSPQTQLSYLCQSFGWKLNFRDGVFAGGIFQVIAEVDFSYKKTEKLLKQSYSAKKKKIGRLISSFKMLKNIYISFPQIWELNENKRSKQNDLQKKQPNNLIKMIEPNIFYEKIQHISQIKEVDQQFYKEKDQYLKRISNYKTEMNLLNHQNPNIFTYKIDKAQPSTGLAWVVKGELNIKYKGIQKTFEASEQNLSAKIAQQNITKIVVTAVYEEYRQILEKMMAVKNKKSIK